MYNKTQICVVNLMNIYDLGRIHADKVGIQVGKFRSLLLVIFSQICNIGILDNGQHYHQRLISKVIYIKGQNSGLNAQDTEMLHNIYFSLLDFVDM